ncbi:uncharacterized protein DMAD_00693 [Drosophila madeirensis]|uniref:Uncharacterized protein n=1 Tax=Drosophila madeirensis TaxID=30013 RepID=A0AAU9FZA0_DROMD
MNPNAMPSPNQETPTTSGKSLPSDARGPLSLSLCLPGYHYRMSAEEKEKHLIPLGLTTLEEIRQFANETVNGNVHVPEIIVKTESDMDSLVSLDSSTDTDTDTQSNAAMDSLGSLDSSTDTDTQSNAASDNSDANEDIDDSLPNTYYQPIAERVKVNKRACTKRE